MSRFLIPPEPPKRAQIDIKRSVFIATAGHAETPEAAHAFIQSIRDEFPDATHNCWAFVAGPPGDSRQIGMSDDGEPHGTAGRPMLNVLLHSHVGEIACVVTRYYGGTKLGTGGLARAYSGAVSAMLDVLSPIERIPRVRCTTTLPYSLHDQFKKILDSQEVLVSDETFGQDIQYALDVPEERVESLREALTQLSLGKCELELG